MILTRILIGVILSLLMLIGVLGTKLYFVNSDKIICEGKVETIDLTSQKDKERYDRYIKSYQDAMKSVVTFYDGEIGNIKKFKRRSNETECEAANRLLNRFGS